ncbi:MAG: nitrous oxide reductase accessory protein NosL [Bacteroidota bacterium]
MKRLSLIVVLLLFISCSKTPEPINYGTDMCHYCKMTIVTKTHAAQMVTDKGKQYKFDAIECMIRFLEDKEDLKTNSNLLIIDYKQPGIMVNARTAGYLVCDEIASPMGANLTGFSSVEDAKKTIDSSNSAMYFDWNGIFKKIN